MRASSLGDVAVETPVTFSAGTNAITLARVRRNGREGWTLTINGDASFYLRGDLLDVCARIQSVIV
jgi:hypothetical protein